MLGQLLRRWRGKPDRPVAPAESFVGRQEQQPARPASRSQPFGPCAHHPGDESYQEFKAHDTENRLNGVGAVFANGDVVIQWYERGHLELPAGCDWQRYFVEWTS